VSIFVALQDAGDPVEIARRYDDRARRTDFLDIRRAATTAT